MAYDGNSSLDLEHPRPLTDIINELNDRLGPDLRRLGTFGAQHWWDQSSPTMPKEWSWIACFVVRGGSEGYYIHIELIDRATNKRKLIALTKLWSWDDAFQLCNAATLILHGEACNQPTAPAIINQKDRGTVLNWGGPTTPFQQMNGDPILYVTQIQSLDERLWELSADNLGFYGWLEVANNHSLATDRVSILDLPHRDWCREYQARVPPEEAADVALDEFASVHGLPIADRITKRQRKP